MNIEIEIQNFFSSDIDEIENWKPQNDSDVYYNLEIEIGEKDEVGGNLFQIEVGTPEGVRKCRESISGIFSDRNLLLVDQYSWRVVKQRLIEIVNHCAASNWEETVTRLQRYFLWEYEDYIFDKS